MTAMKTAIASPSGEPHRTLTDLLFKINDPQKRVEINDFRIKYEEQNGLTDLTKRYTSQMPTKQQQWLFENHQQRCFNGLPDFARDFFKLKIEAAMASPQPQGRLAKDFIAEYMGGRVIGTEENHRQR